MILTGSEIKKEFIAGNITIRPFNKDQINPNSYNYLLGNMLKVQTTNDIGDIVFVDEKISKEGYELQAGKMYLGSTYEVLGSKKYMMSLIGRSSLGRLGMFLQLSANVLHTGTCHNITLEILCTKNLVVYPFMRVGQVSFWENSGEITPYDGYYKQFSGPQESYVSIN